MIEFRIKEKTRSLNESFRGDWRPRAAAAKRQRTKAMQACPKWPGGPLLVVRFVRLSRGTLDFANLAGALKHVQDGVAARLGVDDGSALVEWLFMQAPGEAEVVVQIWKVGEEAPSLPVGRVAEKKGKTLASVEADAGRRIHVAREPGAGAKRAPRQRCNKNGCRRMLPCPDHSHHLMREPFDVALPSGQRLRSPPTKGAKAGRPDYVEAYAPPPERHPDDAAFNAEVMRRVGLKAAQEAEATFAPESCDCVGERHSNECVTQGRHL